MTENFGGGDSVSEQSFTVTVEIPSATDAADISNFHGPGIAQSNSTSPTPGTTISVANKIDEIETIGLSFSFY